MLMNLVNCTDLPDKLDDACSCICHTTGAVYCFPCCFTCAWCKKSRIMFIEKHEEGCPEKPQKEPC